MRCEITPFGLVVPKHDKEPRKPTKQYKPLEIIDDDIKKEVGKHLTALANMDAFQENGAGICLCSCEKSVRLARQQLLWALIKQVMGDDWECEMLC